MKNKKLKLSLMLLLCIRFTGVYAQEAIPASGGNASGSGGSVSYTVGQVIYTTNIGTNGSVTQGVQQPFEISLVTGLDEANRITLICSAYPNPVSDFLKLKVENYNTENLAYQLYDISGKLLETQKLGSNQTIIDMNSLVLATYFLKVTQGNKEVIIFKIVKN